MKTYGFEELRRFAYLKRDLAKIEKRLGSLGAQYCNGNIDHETYEKRVEKPFKRAVDIAEFFGLVAYHQRDPRGCSLYLLQDKKQDYLNGIACC